MAKSRPKEPKTYEGRSYEGKKCPKHKTVKLVKDDHECCGCCCSGCEPVYSCPKCQSLYETAFAKWFGKWGHIVAVGHHLEVRDGRLASHSDDLRFQQFLHGGKPIKLGRWCKIDPETGCIRLARKPWSPNMLVIS